MDDALISQDDEEAPSPTLWLPKRQRRRSPQHNKRLDYKHQRTTVSAGAAFKKVAKLLPRLERLRYRRVLDRATRRALRGDEPAVTAGDVLRATKRSHFRELRARRRRPLAEAVDYKQRKRDALYRCKKERRRGWRIDEPYPKDEPEELR